MMLSFLLFINVLDKLVLRNFKNDEFDFNVRRKLYPTEFTEES